MIIQPSRRISTGKEFQTAKQHSPTVSPVAAYPARGYRCTCLRRHHHPNEHRLHGLYLRRQARKQQSSPSSRLPCSCYSHLLLRSVLLLEMNNLCYYFLKHQLSMAGRHTDLSFECSLRWRCQLLVDFRHSSIGNWCKIDCIWFWVRSLGETREGVKVPVFRDFALLVPSSGHVHGREL